ncbi:phage portal protein [uncultured Faecalibaculum sp.]|uniref:phage portal protein n=1 Tax=uncultured Faecalibaculum sp. TaxID=1729681 RepID=UPI0025F68F54|nr:phage portal protein [uncultured Faecalibaculum sp.]
MAYKSQQPFRLPAPIRCGPEEAQDLSMEKIEYFIQQHQEFMPRYQYLENLYRGLHTIFHDEPKPVWEPDHRMAVNFPLYITSTFCGFGYGIPIKVTHEDESFLESLAAFEEANEIDDHNSELIKQTCIHGHAFEYMYQDEDGNTRVSVLKPSQCFVVYDNSIEERALFAIRYGSHTRSLSDKTMVLYGEVMTADTRVYFDDGRITDEQPQPYGKINVVEWRLNDERMGLYEPVGALCETYERVLSNKANDVAAFAEAILKIVGADMAPENAREALINRIMILVKEGTGDTETNADADYLTKPSADGTQENLLDRLQELIFTISQVANISDESFGSATSGVSLSYKLLAMSNLAKSFDTKISKSIRKRCKLFCQLQTNTPDKDAWKGITLQFTRNIPNNIAEEVQTAVQATTLTSQETALGLLSFVPDPKAELERMEKEKKAAQPDLLDFNSHREVELTDDTEEETAGDEQR